MTRLLRMVLYMGLLITAFICGAAFLRYSVRYFTTTCRLEWVGYDGAVWWHPVDIVAGGLAKVSFSNYWTKNNECYELKIYCGSSNGLVLNDQVEICMMSGSKVIVKETIRLQPDVDSGGAGVYMVVFPKRFSPCREGDSLKVSLSFVGMADVVCIEYKAKLVCHFFDIFTDIT